MKKLKSLIRIFFAILVIPLPNRVKIGFLNVFMGCRIHKTARIGLSYINVKRIEMDENAAIGNFNIIKNLDLLKLANNARIGISNYATAVPSSSTADFSGIERFPALIIGEHSGIVKKHFFDCNDTIEIGKFTLIAGHETSFFTHGVNMENCKQETGKVTIGDYCMIAASCVIVKGAALPSFSALAANSTLHKAHTAPYTLYSGVPAKPIKELPQTYAFFSRTSRYVN